jgi:hypothetical protein
MARTAGTRLQGLARRLARPRSGIAPVAEEVYDAMLRDLDMQDADAVNVKGGATATGVSCGYPGYRCPPGYTCIGGKCYDI